MKPVTQTAADIITLKNQVLELEKRIHELEEAFKKITVLSGATR